MCNAVSALVDKQSAIFIDVLSVIFSPSVNIPNFRFFWKYIHLRAFLGSASSRFTLTHSDMLLSLQAGICSCCCM